VQNDSRFGSNSWKFNGGYLYRNNLSGFLNGNNEFTIDLWFKRSNVSAGSLFGQGIWAYGCNTNYSTSNDYWGGFTTNNTLACNAYYNVGGYGSYNVSASANINPDTTTWHHYACVRDESSQLLKLFYDGVLIASSSLPNTLVLNYALANFAVGSDWGPAASRTCGGNFSGNIDEFRLTTGKALWRNNFTPPSSAYYYNDAKALVMISSSSTDQTINGIVQLGDQNGGNYLQGKTIAFNTNGTEKMRLDSNGLLAIGTTATNGYILTLNDSTNGTTPELKLLSPVTGYYATISRSSTSNALNFSNQVAIGGNDSYTKLY